MNLTRSPWSPAPPTIGPSRRVVVAMSGGVDSSVTAAILARAGHDVIGITLQLYDEGKASGRKGACCAGVDVRDARQVADCIGIPHYVLDYEQRFRKSVIDAFADSYIAGETPVPCVACNREVKFKDMLDVAIDLGADALATGHYIERREAPSGPTLHRPADPERDQSYFLFQTTPAQLDRLWFPLGAMPKAEVRRLATELELPVASKPDSQDICFVGQGGYAEVIGRLRPDAMRPGDVVHVDGRCLGRHQGIINFTVGQRRGLKVAAGEPLYVVRLEPSDARVIVGPRSCLEIDTLVLRDVNWIGQERLEQIAMGGLDLHVRVRSTQAPRPARLIVEDGSVSIRLGEPELGVARGQACVFYADGSPRAQLLGGGTISATSRVGSLS